METIVQYDDTITTWSPYNAIQSWSLLIFGYHDRNNRPLHGPDPEPSQEDLTVTGRAIAAGRLGWYLILVLPVSILLFDTQHLADVVFYCL